MVVWIYTVIVFLFAVFMIKEKILFMRYNETKEGVSLDTEKEPNCLGLLLVSYEAPLRSCIDTC